MLPAFASSDVGAYGTSASPTAGLRSLWNENLIFK